MAKYQVSQGCTLCGTCLYECPAGAISIGTEGAKINDDICIDCGRCMKNCASEAIIERRTDHD